MKSVFSSQLALFVVFTMDLSVEQDSLAAIGSDEFSTSPEILSEETHSLMTCSPDDCPDVHVTASAKQDEGILGLNYLAFSVAIVYFFFVLATTVFLLW